MFTTRFDASSGVRIVRCIAILLGLLLLVTPAYGQRSVNRGLHAVPAPAGLKFDDLSTWDTSGAILCCKDVAKKDLESARVSAQWDQDNLYLALEFRDPMPMQNRIDPVTMPGNGWRSDCVQLRCNMAGFVSHIDAW